ncbi:hypothetical protein [Candidatus Nitrosotalea sp. TS]|uniref:hypothetical protein n=1 Tax=Candidatus Nitrosotalea sp. TS TaxID=2341020 RepID=UPI001C49840E|nr:hypothetical protein [Candidatus Nitrosotalea sp. TS]
MANLGVSLPSHSDLSSKPHDVNTYSKGDSIQVSESVSVAVNGKPYETPSSSSNPPPGNFDQLNTITVKENSNSVTTMDKIFNSERLRFNGRTLVKYNPVQDYTYGEKLSAIGNIMVQESDKNSGLANGKISDMSPVIFSDLHSGMIFSGQGEDLPEQLLKLVQDQDYTKYSALLVIIPITGSVLICATNPKIAARSKSICSFVFMIILVSSIVTTPMSISGNYVRQAFAEQENNTNGSNSTQPLSFNNFSNSTQPNFAGFSNSTQPLSFNTFQTRHNRTILNSSSNSTSYLNLQPTFQTRHSQTLQDFQTLHKWQQFQMPPSLGTLALPTTAPHLSVRLAYKMLQTVLRYHCKEMDI